jgi:hypothetical protein
MLTKIFWVTFALVAVYLVLQNAAPYSTALLEFNSYFRQVWLSLTKGKQFQ